jgi:hypothetical protein
MSSVDQNFEESLEEELAKIDPATLQYLFEQLVSENVPAVRKIVKNVLDERIPRETEKLLQKPLRPKIYESRRTLQRQKRARKEEEILRQLKVYAVLLSHRSKSQLQRLQRKLLSNFN